MRNSSQSQMLDRSPRKQQIATDSSPEMTFTFICSVINGIELRSQAEKGSRETAGSCCCNDTSLSQPGLCSSTEMLIRLIKKSSPISNGCIPLLLSSPPSSLAFVVARESSHGVRIEWSHKPEEGPGPWRNMKKTCFL